MLELNVLTNEWGTSYSLVYTVTDKHMQCSLMGLCLAGAANAFFAPSQSLDLLKLTARQHREAIHVFHLSLHFPSLATPEYTDITLRDTFSQRH